MSTRLISSFQRTHSVIQDGVPLSDDRILRVVPSIFAEAPHGSRSERYTHIPTSRVLAGLRKEGFQPFFACQTRVRLPERADFTKHMIRLRHASRINGAEANEIILVNSHDGSSAYQMLAGVFRFVCTNGMVCGEEVEDFRVPHRGDVVGQVVEGAYRILDGFERIDAARDGMRAVELRPAEQRAFARAALALRFEGNTPPVTEGQALAARRHDDKGDDLWRVLNRAQENLIRGGLPARTANQRRTRTRPVAGIDQNVKINRGLWVLADEMRKLKEGDESLLALAAA